MFKRNRVIDGALTPQALRGWLVDEVARYVGCHTSEVDTTKSFDAYGLDSRTAVQLSGRLERIVELTDHLSNELQLRPA
jgi:hypothetical protein